MTQESVFYIVFITRPLKRRLGKVKENVLKQRMRGEKEDTMIAIALLS